MLDHLAIEVQDFDAALQFLCDALGLTCRRTGTLASGAGMRIAVLGAPNGSKIELVEADTPAPRLGHVAFRSPDVDGDFAALIGSGCTAVTEPKRLEPARARTAVVDSPIGLRVQLIDYDADSPDL